MGRIALNDGKKSFDSAFRYFAIAITYGESEKYYGNACHLAGYILMQQGKLKESVNYVLKAVNSGQNIGEAWYNLAILVENKVCHLKDDEYCSSYPSLYRKAADMGCPEAMFRVAKDLYGLYCIEKDPSDARDYLESAERYRKMAIDAGYEPAKRLYPPNKRGMKPDRPFVAGSHNNQDYSHSYTSFSNDFRSSKSSPFVDGRGNLTVEGNVFYDAKGNLCEWGQPFYDFKGNYCEWGGTFYDSKGNLCSLGSPFYDGKGNYIVP
ncbi:MAG: sel1 repeat family protein [Ruminococcaceae bacterium]|nr:sel1 repeat family protein [Oscillospiraceae bacterium]